MFGLNFGKCIQNKLDRTKMGYENIVTRKINWQIQISSLSIAHDLRKRRRKMQKKTCRGAPGKPPGTYPSQTLYVVCINLRETPINPNPKKQQCTPERSTE